MRPRIMAESPQGKQNSGRAIIADHGGVGVALTPGDGLRPFAVPGGQELTDEKNRTPGFGSSLPVGNSAPSLTDGAGV